MEAHVLSTPDRRALGLMIFSGLSIGPVFTLFIVPDCYNLSGADRNVRTMSGKQILATDFTDLRGNKKRR